MAVSIPNQYPVQLTAQQRETFAAITRNGRSSAKTIRHAQVLLLSDGGRADGRLTRDQIAQRLDMHVNTVDRIRKRFVVEGEAPALHRKPRAAPPVPPKIDGRLEAHLVAICCSPAPAGRARWTLRLLADELKARHLVTSVCVETVRRVLKKTNSSRGEKTVGAFRNATERGSSPTWKTSSTSTPSRPRRRSR